MLFVGKWMHCLSSSEEKKEYKKAPQNIRFYPGWKTFYSACNITGTFYKPKNNMNNVTRPLLQEEFDEYVFRNYKTKYCNGVVWNMVQTFTEEKYNERCVDYTSISIDLDEDHILQEISYELQTKQLDEIEEQTPKKNELDEKEKQTPKKIEQNINDPQAKTSVRSRKRKLHYDEIPR